MDYGTVVLPQTGSNLFAYLLVGAFLLVLGASVLYYTMKQKQEAK